MIVTVLCWTVVDVLLKLLVTLYIVSSSWRHPEAWRSQLRWTARSIVVTKVVAYRLIVHIWPNRVLFYPWCVHHDDLHNLLVCSPLGPHLNTHSELVFTVLISSFSKTPFYYWLDSSSYSYYIKDIIIFTTILKVYKWISISSVSFKS